MFRHFFICMCVYRVTILQRFHLVCKKLNSNDYNINEINIWIIILKLIVKVATPSPESVLHILYTLITS